MQIYFGSEGGGGGGGLSALSSLGGGSGGSLPPAQAPPLSPYQIPSVGQPPQIGQGGLGAFSLGQGGTAPFSTLAQYIMKSIFGDQ